MRNHILRYLLLFVLVLLQTTLLEYAKIGNTKADLVLIFILYFGIKCGPINGQMLGFIGGLLLDLSTTYFGLNMLIYTIIGFLAGTFYKKIYIETILGTFSYVFLGTLFKGIIYFAISYFLIGALVLGDMSTYFINTLLLELILNALPAPFIFNFLNKFDLT